MSIKNYFSKNELLMQLKNLALVILGTVVLGFGCAIFVVPFNLVTGGVTGISIIVNAAFDLSLNIIPAIIFGAVGSTAGQLGDLAFSLIKRESALKDYGKIFPGHGGVYDRFDSITFAASFFEIFCLYIYSII